MNSAAKVSAIVLGLGLLASANVASAQRAAADKARGDYGVAASPQPADTVLPRANLNRVTDPTPAYNFAPAPVQAYSNAPARSFSYAPAPQTRNVQPQTAPRTMTPAPSIQPSAPRNAAPARRFSYQPQPTTTYYAQPTYNANPRRQMGYHDAAAKVLGNY